MYFLTNSNQLAPQTYSDSPLTASLLTIWTKKHQTLSQVCPIDSNSESEVFFQLDEAFKVKLET